LQDNVKLKHIWLISSATVKLKRCDSRKIARSNYRVVMTVRPSVHISAHSGLILMKFDILIIFQNL